jgi:membrane associated rhomboid family serine protease
MGFSEYNTNFISNEGRVTPAVRWLLAANIGVYFLQLVLFGTDNFATWFGLSAEEFPSHWWTVGTYMFVHGGLMHLTLNMLMLWMFGPRVEREFGTRAFAKFYVWCGLGGAIFHLLLVGEGVVIGASGAVVGVVLAFALRWPDENLYLFGVIPMRARWLAVWMIAWNVGMALMDMSGYSHSQTAWMSHVGGLVFAWLYLNGSKGGGLDRIRRHVATVPDDRDIRPVPKSRRYRRQESGEVADEVVAKSNALFKKQTQHPQSAAMLKSRRRAQEVDALLDKISLQGIDSLTPEERKLLEEISRRLRG